MPAYDEEGRIAKVIVAAKRYADKIIVCEDGSSDDTGEIAGDLGAQVIVHEGNPGYGAALTTLFEEVKRKNADVFVILDSDGQHQPHKIPELVEPILEGRADLVIGSSVIPEGFSPFCALLRHNSV